LVSTKMNKSRLAAKCATSEIIPTTRRPHVKTVTQAR
jgi:hypothetical protein